MRTTFLQFCNLLRGGESAKPKAEKPSAVQRTTHTITSHFAFRNSFFPMQCSQAGLEAPQHPRCSDSSREHEAEKTKRARCGGARLWVCSSTARNLHAMLHVDSPLLAQLFPNLVSQHDVSKPQVSFLSEKNITVNPSNKAYSFPLPHLLLPSYHKGKSPFIIQGLILPTCLTGPQS